MLPRMGVSDMPNCGELEGCQREVSWTAWDLIKQSSRSVHWIWEELWDWRPRADSRCWSEGQESSVGRTMVLWKVKKDRRRRDNRDRWLGEHH